MSEDLYDTIQTGKIDLAIDILFDNIDNMLLASDFEGVADYVNTLNVNQMESNTLYATLAVICPHAHKLHVGGYIEKAKARLKEITPQNYGSLIDGIDAICAMHSIGKKMDWNNKKEVLDSVSVDGRWLRYASKELQNDVDVVLVAVSESGCALEFASNELQNDYAIVLSAVTQDGFALQYASSNLRRRREIVLRAVRSYGWALRWASEDLKNDREIVLAAVEHEGCILKLAADELRNDPEIRKAAGLA